MKTSQFRNVHATALALCAALAATPAAAATLRADYTLDFRPPNPNCAATALGDLTAATLGGALGFAWLDAAGNLVQIQPGPPQITGLACGVSYSGSFSFDAAPASALVFVSFGGDLTRPPNPNLPLYAFATGTDPASLTDPGAAPLIPMAVSLEKSPGPQQLPLYAFSNGGAYDVGALNVTVQSVPLPAATWLFGSGLLGLVGVARIKGLRQNAAAM